MIHLTLPAFGYLSAPPYIVSVERATGDVWHKGADTITVALLMFFDEDHSIAYIDEPAIARIVDRRGVCVLGIDQEHEDGYHPNLVATEEVLLAMRSMMPEIAGGIETFEMAVRETYVHLRGGT